MHITDDGRVCGYASLLGFTRRGEETLVGVVLKPQNGEIPLRTVLCRKCLAEYLKQGLVQYWLPLIEFIESENQLAVLMERQFRQQCQQAARETSQKNQREARHCRQSAWRRQVHCGRMN